MRIIKGPSPEIKELTQDELEERMVRFGHTSFRARCFHTLTKEIPDPKGNVPKEICCACGEEILWKKN